MREKHIKIKVEKLPKDMWINNITRVLLDSSDFMIPSKVNLRGSNSASGGLIFVEKDGTTYCTIYSSKDDAGEYLYRTSVFDTASTSRHDFGKIYIEPCDDYMAIKLNLNIKGAN